MKLQKAATNIFQLILSAAVCSPALCIAALPETALTIPNTGYGDITGEIEALNQGIFGHAETSDILVGNINANITVGSSTNWGNNVGIVIDWATPAYNLTLGNLTAESTVKVSSHKFATGISLARNTTMGKILGNVIASSNIEAATGITLISSVNVESIEGMIDVDSASGDAYGLNMHSQVNVGLVSGDIHVNSASGNASGLDLKFDSFIDDFSSNLTVHSDSGNATGISIASNSTIGKKSGKGIAGLIKVSSTTGTARGLYITDINYNTVSGRIEVQSQHEAIGIELYNDGKLGTIEESAVIEVTLQNNGSNAGNAYGIKAADDDVSTGYAISDIKGDFSITNHTSSADTSLGNAYGIYMAGDGNLGAIATKDHVHESTSSITVQSIDKDKAYGIYSEASKTIYFEAGSIIKANSVDNAHGYAIYNDVNGITLAEAKTSGAGNSFLHGNLHAGDHALTFESGDFQISSDTWTASNIVLGATSSTAALQTAHVTVTDIMTTNATSIDFYLNTVEDFSQLTVNAGGAFDLSSINEVNFHFSQEFIEVWGVDYFNKISLATGALTVQDMEHITVNMYGEGLVETEYIISDSEISIFILPEPSTATMSLIALIALMSRRRRS